MSKYAVISGPYFPVFRLNFSCIIFPVFNPNTGKYGPEITSYLDTFHAVEICVSRFSDGEDGNLICEGGCCFGGAVGSIL